MAKVFFFFFCMFLCVDGVLGGSLSGEKSKESILKYLCYSGPCLLQCKSTEFFCMFFSIAPPQQGSKVGLSCS